MVVKLFDKRILRRHQNQQKRSLLADSGKRVSNYRTGVKINSCRDNTEHCVEKYTCLKVLSSSSRYAHQSGVVLVVSLIMLLLLTIIGLTGSQVTSLEEKMAGNNRDYNLAFQAAESALRTGEAATSTVTSSGLYIGTALPTDWSVTNANINNYSGGTLSGVYQAPRYIIELLDTTTAPGSGAGGSFEVGVPPVDTGVSWYRITARATGGTSNAVVILQSIYRQ